MIFVFEETIAILTNLIESLNVRNNCGKCVCTVDTHLPHAPPTTPSVFDGQFLLRRLRASDCLLLTSQSQPT